MSFSFGFRLDDNEGGAAERQDNPVPASSSATTSSIAAAKLIPFSPESMANVPYREIKIDDEGMEPMYTIQEVGKDCCTSLYPSHAHRILLQPGIMDAPEDTDLIPGVYEGGLKLWESSIDLVRFMRHRQDDLNLHPGSYVLELGCGHGLPLIHALQKGARCCFMDLNEEVLQHVTGPNIALNLRRRRRRGSIGEQEGGEECSDTDDVKDRVMMISGDWDDASRVLKETWKSLEGLYFDLILSAETIYTPAVTDKMVTMLQRHLHPSRGLALIAGKRYYFGTGGSIVGLIEKASAAGFQAQVVESIEDGRSNIRDIVSVRYYQGTAVR